MSNSKFHNTGSEQPLPFFTFLLSTASWTTQGAFLRDMKGPSLLKIPPRAKNKTVNRPDSGLEEASEILLSLSGVRPCVSVTFKESLNNLQCVQWDESCSHSGLWGVFYQTRACINTHWPPVWCAWRIRSQTAAVFWIISWLNLFSLLYRCYAVSTLQSSLWVLRVYYVNICSAQRECKITLKVDVIDLSMSFSVFFYII